MTIFCNFDVLYEQILITIAQKFLKALDFPMTLDRNQTKHLLFSVF